jgi:hypothetical protein
MRRSGQSGTFNVSLASVARSVGPLWRAWSDIGVRSASWRAWPVPQRANAQRCEDTFVCRGAGAAGAGAAGGIVLAVGDQVVVGRPAAAPATLTVKASRRKAGTVA